MRAHAINTIRPRRNRWRTVAALALGTVALAIPSIASGNPIDSSYSRADAIAAGLEESSQPVGGSNYSSVNSIAGPSSTPSPVSGSPGASSGYSSLNAISGPAGEPALVSSPPTGVSDGFDVPSAAVGAGAAMALVALGAVAFLTLRRRPAISPASTS